MERRFCQNHRVKDGASEDPVSSLKPTPDGAGGHDRADGKTVLGVLRTHAGPGTPSTAKCFTEHGRRRPQRGDGHRRRMARTDRRGRGRSGHLGREESRGHGNLYSRGSQYPVVQVRLIGHRSPKLVGTSSKMSDSIHRPHKGSDGVTSDGYLPLNCLVAINL